MKALPISIICFAILLAACDARETRVNNKEDLENGQKISTEFLEHRKTMDLEKAMELTQIANDNPEYGRHISNLKKIDDMVGRIVEFKVDSARSSVVKEGNELNGEIKVSYTVVYQRGQATEDYYMGYVNDKLKIIQYVVDL